MDIKAVFRCDRCGQYPSIRVDDSRWISVKCRCHIVVIYPSTIVTEIKAEEYIRCR